MLSCTDVLTMVHSELGQPPIQVVAPSAGPRTLRDAVEAARRHADGGLLVLLCADNRAVTMARTRLATQRRISQRIVPVEEGDLLLVHVQPSESQKNPARGRTARWTTPDAGPVADATEDDLEDDVLVRLLEHVDERYPAPFGSNTERYLGRRGLLAHDGHRWRPTLAALLVARRRPEHFVASCAVELHVDGTASELDGAVPEVVRRFGEGVVPGVDPDLLAEVVLNALLHRNWAVDAPVRVALTGERLLAISSGAIAAGAPRRAVHPNPLLVHFATTLGLATGTGRGLRDVARRLARIRRRPLSLVERPGEVWFVADVRRPSPSRRPPKATSSPASTPPVPPRERTKRPAPSGHPAAAPTGEPGPANAGPAVVPRPEPAPTTAGPCSAASAPPSSRSTPASPRVLLPRDPDDRADAVLATLRARGRTTTREIARALGCSRPVVGKVLTALVDDGRVRATQGAGRSPFQSYEVVNDADAG